MIRSIVAVVCGFLITVVLALGADGVLVSLVSSFTENGKTENLSLLVLMLVYTLAFFAVGGYVTALVAKRAELKHALALGVLGLALSIFATVQNAETMPLWWQIISLILIVPFVILGGYLRIIQKGSFRQRTA